MSYLHMPQILTYKAFYLCNVKSVVQGKFTSYLYSGQCDHWTGRGMSKDAQPGLSHFLPWNRKKELPKGDRAWPYIIRPVGPFKLSQREPWNSDQITKV